MSALAVGRDRRCVMRTGDTVFHRPTGERWLVAYCVGNRLAWSGWPEGEAYTADCELVRACSDEEHEKHLREWADKPHRRDDGSEDLRASMCRWLLEEWLATRATGGAR